MSSGTAAVRALGVILCMSLFTAGVILSSTASRASDLPDPCDNFSVANGDGKWSVAASFFRLFQRSAHQTDQSRFFEREYYFVSNPGRFAHLTCDERQFEFQDMYTLGLVVKPLQPVDLPDFSQGGRIPILVQTEYGHKKIMDERDIRPINPDLIYIFSDTFSSARPCRDAENCPGNNVEVCGNSCYRYDISPVDGYVTVSRTSDVALRVISEYGRVVLDQTQQSGSRSEGDGVIDLCTPFPARAYKFDAVPHQAGHVHLSLCNNQARNSVHPFKVVDLEYAKRAFSQRPHLPSMVSYHRDFGAGPSVLGLVEEIFSFSSVKECGTTLTTSSGVSARGGFKAGIGTGAPIAFSIDVGSGVSSTIEHIHSPDDFLRISTYFVRPFGSRAQSSGTANEFWMFRIVARARCVDGVPLLPTSIAIHMTETAVPTGSLSIIASLEERSVGLSAAYLRMVGNDHFRLFGELPEERASPQVIESVADGQFWWIPDHIAYFLWRDVIREYLRTQVPGFANWAERFSAEEERWAADAMTHLILAAAFRHNRPINARR